MLAELLPLFFVAAGIRRCRLADRINRMCIQITPHSFVHESPVGRVFVRPAARLDAAVRSTGIAPDVEIGDQSARVRVGWNGLIDVDDWPKFVHPQ